MIFISEARLKKMISDTVTVQMQALLWGWDKTETPGLYREFDSLHARFNELNLKVLTMQARIDEFNALLKAIDGKIDELKGKAGGIPVEVFDALAEQLRAILAKLSA